MDQQIEALLKTTIQAKVIEAFNTTPEMVEKLIAAAFNKPVSENTGHPKTSHEYGVKEVSYLDWLVGHELRNAAREAVREYMVEHNAAVKAKVVAAIQAGEFGSKIGERVAEMMEQDWRWSFSIERKD